MGLLWVLRLNSSLLVQLNSGLSLCRRDLSRPPARYRPILDRPGPAHSGTEVLPDLVAQPPQGRGGGELVPSLWAEAGEFVAQPRPLQRRHSRVFPVVRERRAGGRPRAAPGGPRILREGSRGLQEPRRRAHLRPRS